MSARSRTPITTPTTTPAIPPLDNERVTSAVRDDSNAAMVVVVVLLDASGSNEDWIKQQAK
jgi:hypothetical protein